MLKSVQFHTPSLHLTSEVLANAMQLITRRLLDPTPNGGSLQAGQSSGTPAQEGHRTHREDIIEHHIWDR